MVDVGLQNKGSKWVCPNDRQLALRAKLRTGWSVKTHDLQTYGKKPPSLNEAEQNIIREVIQKAEQLEMKEQERVGRLVDRLDNMKRNVMGNGTNQCILCGDSFGIFGRNSFLCHDCKKFVCEKCGIETFTANQEQIWLCKICSETREMWKKSGAWFFKGLPKYKLPDKKNDKFNARRLTRPGLEKNNWSRSTTSLNETQSKSVLNRIEAEDETSSEDDKSSKRPLWSRARTDNLVVNKMSTLNVSSAEKGPKSPSGVSNLSGSGFFNTSSDSGVGECERNSNLDKCAPKEKYRREVSGESSGSSLSRQTSSTFSESQPNLTSSNPYLSSINQSYEKLSQTYEKSTKMDKSPLSPVFDDAPISFLKKSPINLEKAPMYIYEKPKYPTKPEDYDVFERKIVPPEKPARRLPTPNYTKSNVDRSRSGSSHSVTYDRSPTNDPYDRSPTKYDKMPINGRPPYDRSRMPEYNDKQLSKLEEIFEQPRSSSYSDLKLKKTSSKDSITKGKKKSSIDFGKAASFLKAPLKSDRFSRFSKNENCKLSKFSTSETSLESTIDEANSRRTSSYSSQLGANHWMSQESGMDVADGYSIRTSRRGSINSTSSSRDFHWSEDQTSLASTQSSANEQNERFSGTNIQLGSIELSLWYDPVRSALHCSLHRARGLRPMDMNGLSDPFCKLNILPTCGKSQCLKTKTVHKTINPEFNEAVVFYGVAEADIERKTLHVLVLDDDKYGNDFLGEAKIPLDSVGVKQTKHFSVFLEKHFPTDENDEVVWGSDGCSRGQILITLCYSTKRRALIVGIVRCANLVSMDRNGFSDPFVKLHLRPDPNHRKCKTSVKWKNLNPVFNEEFVLETKMTDLPTQTLVLTVWDKDYGKSNDYLGGLELGWKSKGDRLKQWIDMIKFPDHKHEGWHSLGEDLIIE